MKFSDKVTNMPKDKASFVACWEEVFAKIFGDGDYRMIKRMVAELVFSGPDLFGSPAAAALEAGGMGMILADNSGTLTATIFGCFAELCYVVASGGITPEDAQELMSEWWHGFYTKPQIEAMKAKGLTPEGVRRLQKDINQEGRAGVPSHVKNNVATVKNVFDLPLVNKAPAAPPSSSNLN